MERALITGGAGCIGSDLAEALVARGDSVVVLDNLSSGKREHLATLAGRPGFEFIEGDLLDPETVVAAVRRVDIVYHLAANPDVRFSETGPTDRDLRQNVVATYNVLEAMRREGPRQLVFTSTSAVYGLPERLPISEDGQAPRPISLYGATKLSAEALISAFSHLFGIRAWIFRLANIVGPKSRRYGATVLGDFIARLRRDPSRLEILGDGRQAKSYLSAAECIEAMLFAVERSGEALNVFNIGCEDWITVRRIAEMVVEEMGLGAVEFEFGQGEGGWPGDVPRFRLDVARINRLGWKAKQNSEQAVRQAIQGLLRVEL